MLPTYVALNEVVLVDRFYVALFPALEQTLRFCHTGFQMSDCCFLQRVLNINRSGV